MAPLTAPSLVDRTTSPIGHGPATSTEAKPYLMRDSRPVVTTPSAWHEYEAHESRALWAPDEAAAGRRRW
ncbi:hypothetical protein BN12_270021 [Nostocoides japonicum T1-X7]|uniref:Uncharacterized protein n=1 Tax=Nostocoides japonicum T1-X7 TaxID=1194083 RepID=A0A077M279_9MICO|nr:hypothetical protein BN12_270021 [Tetrasphaera japonica T1-X7]